MHIENFLICKLNFDTELEGHIIRVSEVVCLGNIVTFSDR